MMQKFMIPTDSSKFLVYFDMFIDIKMAHDASDFFDFFLSRLELETSQLTIDKKLMSQSPFINELCMLKIVRETRCNKGHILK
jgi:hypothetical protein